MITRLFITVCLAAMACASHAEDTSIKIGLGIRDTQLLTITNMVYPLAFRFENTGKEAIKGRHIADIYAKGTIHVLSTNGMEQSKPVGSKWHLGYGIVPNDLQTGEITECKVVGDPLTFFPSLDDGDYQIWWTLEDLKSNNLSFTVANGKVTTVKAEDPTNPLQAGALPDFQIRSARPAEKQPNIIAVGEWSEPVTNHNGLSLRGRLLMSKYDEPGGGHNFTDDTFGLFVEFEDCSQSGAGQQIYFNGYERGLNCNLTDAVGNIIPSTGVNFGALMRLPRWLTLTPGSRASARADFRISRNNNGFEMVLENAQSWTIKSYDTNTYYLSGTFSAIPTDKAPNKELFVWSGMLKFPRMKLSTGGK